MNIFKSIYIKVSIVLVISILTIMFCESLITIIVNNRKSMTNATNYSNNLKKRLINILRNPFWSLDKNTLEALVIEEMDDKNIVSIILRDYNSKVIFGYEKYGKNNLKKIDLTKKRVEYGKDYIQFFDKIDKNKITMGFIELVISKKNLNPPIASVLLKTVFRASILSVLMIVLIYFSIKKLILDRIVSVKKTVNEFTVNDYSERCEVMINDEIGDLAKTFNAMADVLQDYNLELLTQLYFDRLTDLPNRKKLILDIEKEKNPVFILVNIDAFQEINDFYGHEVGDKILLEMARRLKSSLFKKGLNVYKMSGDEFAVLSNLSAYYDKNFEVDFKKSVIDTLFEEINDKVFCVENNEINIRITIGVAYHDSVHPFTEENEVAIINKKLLMYADMALKKAKKTQKHFLIYTDKMQISKEYENNIKWTLELKKAVNENRIVPYFQPILNNKTGKIEKYECLVRLIAKNGKPISPFEFLNVAKKSRIYPFITKIMIAKSFDVFSKLDYEFSINLSIYDILSEDISNYIKFKLLEYKGLSKNVVFEILESEGIDNYDKIKDFIDFAKFLGCKIAIDDFGSGYSNFSHVLRLNVDYIKIDASMIKNIDKDQNSQIITKTIVNFAKELGIKTVSEFVHSESVYKKVNELGVDFSQGYYFGEPASHPQLNV